MRLAMITRARELTGAGTQGLLDIVFGSYGFIGPESRGDKQGGLSSPITSAVDSGSRPRGQNEMSL